MWIRKSFLNDFVPWILLQPLLLLLCPLTQTLMVRRSILFSLRFSVWLWGESFFEKVFFFVSSCHFLAFEQERQERRKEERGSFVVLKDLLSSVSYLIATRRQRDLCQHTAPPPPITTIIFALENLLSWSFMILPPPSSGVAFSFFLSFFWTLNKKLKWNLVGGSKSARALDKTTPPQQAERSR